MSNISDSKAVFQLAGVPSHLLFSIFKKCGPTEFVRFLRTNKYMSGIGLSRSHYIRLKVKEIFFGGLNMDNIYLTYKDGANRCLVESKDRAPFYFEACQVMVVTGRVPLIMRKRFLNAVDKFKIQTERLEISYKATGDELSDYIERIKTKSLISYALSFSGKHLQALSCGNICARGGVLQITGQDINLLIKQWYENKREIEEVDIIETEELSTQEIVDELPVELVTDDNRVINSTASFFEAVYTLSKPNCDTYLLIIINTRWKYIKIKSIPIDTKKIQ